MMEAMGILNYISAGEDEHLLRAGRLARLTAIYDDSHDLDMSTRAGRTAADMDGG